MKVRIIFFLISLFVFSLNAQNWQLVWEDDFNGSSLNQSKWVHDIGTGSQYGMCDGVMGSYNIINLKIRL